MTLEPKDALTQYHFAERLKLDIMMIAHQYLTIPSLKKEEKAGAKRVLINIRRVQPVRPRFGKSRRSHGSDYHRSRSRMGSAPQPWTPLNS